MKGFDPRTSFGYDMSKRYDAVDTRGDEEQTVRFLARLAGQRDALEFAVGTGRIALPLMAAGVRVDGIEMSAHMVDRIHEKPGGNNVEVTMGDTSRHAPLPASLMQNVPRVPGTSLGTSTVPRHDGAHLRVGLSGSTTRSAICSRRTTRCGASRTPRAT